MSNEQVKPIHLSVNVRETVLYLSWDCDFPPEIQSKTEYEIYLKYAKQDDEQYEYTIGVIYYIPLCVLSDPLGRLCLAGSSFKSLIYFVAHSFLILFTYYSTTLLSEIKSLNFTKSLLHVTCINQYMAHMETFLNDPPLRA